MFINLSLKNIPKNQNKENKYLKIKKIGNHFKQ